MADVIFVRTPSSAHAPRDLAAEGGTIRIQADTPVALEPDGPFVPLATALGEEPRLRDALSRELPIGSLRGHRRLRLAIALLALLPASLLIFVDGRAALAAEGGPLRFVLIDIALASYVAFELMRPTPRSPSTAALALTAIALRWTVLVARLCGRDLPLYVYLAPLAAAAATLVILVRMPSPSRVALELLDQLGISRREAEEATRLPPPPGPLVGFAIAAAVALPALLYMMRGRGITLGPQALVLVAYAIVMPLVGRRIARPGEPLLSGPPAGGTPPRRILWGIGLGLVVTMAIMTAARSFFDSGTELARCLDRLDAEARRLAALEAQELSDAILRVRGSRLLFALTAVVFPFAEERIYRGLLQDVLVKKYGAAYGLFASAVVFGVAHVPVYQAGLYQTVLLGIAFGVTYLEGGLIAAVVVHAVWNLLLLA